MTLRVEVTSPHINTNNLVVRRARVENRNGLLTICDQDEAQRIIPGQKFATRLGEGGLTVLLVEEEPSVTTAPAGT